MSRKATFALFMRSSGGTRAERRRMARTIYRASRSPFGNHESRFAESRAMRRAPKPKNGSKPVVKQGKYANKRVSIRQYIKGWLLTDKTLYHTHLDKAVRKGKSFMEIQRLRKKQFNAERKRAMLAKVF